MSWWILVMMFGGAHDADRIPRAMGPYPSETLCKVAGHAIMGDDRKFFSDEDIARADEAVRVRTRAREAEIAALPMKAGSYQLKSGELVVRLKDGGIESAGMLGSSTASFYGSSAATFYSALTGCVNVEDAK